ncbi:MAG: ribonucleoside-diphosphate reductase [Actinobacteria bacterium]|nr:ribonucleoside-diphosphate reductase [Actinomycetota bacterium]
MAPEHTGIGIRRRFTTNGVHPYDMVVWERRDARITNFRDGSVAFEQLDVEVPANWSLNATNILAQKYFRGTLGTPERETSLRQVADRVVDTITTWGRRDGYFVDDEEAEAFSDELKYLIVTQRAAFNSPVWFNIGVKGVPQQGSACFILSVDDRMDSILNWYAEEGTIFKGGSGAGVNLSKIRSSVELLKGGGTASGPVSFMRGADASAGTIKSGGKTRRAAKMVILDVGHPDIEEFIWCKAKEEHKARVLRDAGFDMDLDGTDSHSIQYQNANNSVRVTDEFMQAVIDDGDWHLRAVTTGEIVKTVRARDLMRQISQATWECADPGMQFDTTINRWHTAANTGRINGSNPCFPGDALVHTDKGLVAFADLIERVRLGESFGIYTHDATNPDSPAEQLQITSPEAVMITGLNEIVKLRFSNGAELRCTPNHRIFTTNRGYVEAGELQRSDKVKTLELPAPAAAADNRLPVSTEARDYADRDRRTWQGVVLPEKWSDELAHYLGWLVGDGGVSGDVATTVYGTQDDRACALPVHQKLLTDLNAGRVPEPLVQANATVQLHQSHKAITRFFAALGVSDAPAREKTVPWSVREAPRDTVAAFLRGLFDADGCVRDHEKSPYVGLGSVSRQLLVDVQRLLSTFGIFSQIHATRKAGGSMLTHLDKEATSKVYDGGELYDLRITGESMRRYAAEIGFDLPTNAATLSAAVSDHGWHKTDTTVRLVDREDDGVEMTYNLSEPRNHSYIVNGLVVRNCSEYMHLDNSACNLASLNLLTFLDDDDNFDVDGFKHAVEVVFTGQEIIVGNADYPTKPIGDTSRRFRQLGLGYANLGAMLMALGLPYDSDEGRAWAGAITALMTGHAYATSARTAARMGPFSGYTDNEEHMLRVLGMHRQEAANIDEDLVPFDLLAAAQQSWDEACETASVYGVRNSQASVLAPTGCLVGGSLIATERGLVRLGSLGDPDGEQWQTLDLDVATDHGAKRATNFYVNGAEPVVNVVTKRGYHIAGTTKHRIKVVDENGDWQWRRFADLVEGDLVPLALNQLVGEPQEVVLPPMSEKMAWSGEHHVEVPRRMTAELAELVGYFMGDGSLHARGLRLCVSAEDIDVVEHLERLAKGLFGIQALVVPQDGYVSVELNSVRLAEWWEACGLAKRKPHADHRGEGYVPHVPNAVLYSNDRDVYTAFVRGLFEADGNVTVGYPSWTTSSLGFSYEVQSLLLAIGYPTTRKFEVSGGGSKLAVLRLLNRSMNERWLDGIGFLSERKHRRIDVGETQQPARDDHIPVSRDLLERVVPANGPDRRAALMEFRRDGSITRRLAADLVVRTADAELQHLLGFFYDRVVSAELGDEELTFDLSVPENVTYVANGFISHNTIGLLMDCDTTGIEPDLGLCKMKKLVGGGTMTIVNQTIPRALKRLGYTPEQSDEIIAYVDEHKTILGAPHLVPEHVPVFSCSMGDNAIHYLGHVTMMGAVQPFISGAISKTVNMPEEATVDDVEALHVEAWELGLKAVAIYRDNCKVAQPLAMAKKEDKAGAEVQAFSAQTTEITERIVEKIVEVPVREKLPRTRRSRTFEFRVADCKGFVTVGEYDDGRPGELFVRVSKQGSTLAGIMDAFAIAISHGLQYGVPLRSYIEAFSGMRFEPAGMTDDPDIRMAQSLMDYLFRKLAVMYLSQNERAELNIFTIAERMQPTLPGVEESVVETVQGHDLPPDPPSIESAAELAARLERAAPAKTSTAPTRAIDAPMCMQCGVQMQRAGSCHACPSCGNTSGCS